MTRPADRPGLLSPSTLAPVEIDLRTVFRVGIALWSAALLVTAALWLAGRLGGHAVPICVAGVLLGGLALLWERRRARHLARVAADAGSPGSDAGSPGSDA